MVTRGKKEVVQQICLVEMIWKIKIKIQTRCLTILAHIIIIKMEISLEIWIKENLMDSPTTEPSVSTAMVKQEVNQLQSKITKLTNKNQLFKSTGA
jgi:hypothetical protein